MHDGLCLQRGPFAGKAVNRSISALARMYLPPVGQITWIASTFAAGIVCTGRVRLKLASQTRKQQRHDESGDARV